MRSPSATASALSSWFLPDVGNHGGELDVRVEEVPAAGPNDDVKRYRGEPLRLLDHPPAWREAALEKRGAELDPEAPASGRIARLKEAGIWALSHYSVESLYYHPKIIARIALRQATIIGEDAAALSQSATTSAITGAKANRDHLVTSAVLRSARSEVESSFPNRKDIESATAVK